GSLDFCLVDEGQITPKTCESDPRATLVARLVDPCDGDLAGTRGQREIGEHLVIHAKLYARAAGASNVAVGNAPVAAFRVERAEARTCERPRVVAERRTKRAAEVRAVTVLELLRAELARSRRSTMVDVAIAAQTWARRARTRSGAACFAVRQDGAIRAFGI